jgi:pyruvate/2-oxoglutarate dehydrogenase complex dihydrolipoamide dehydrogenase (E3) component
MLVERHHFGGTCVNNGCVPTTTLVASACAAHVARTAADFGVLFDSPIRLDMAVSQSTQGPYGSKINNGCACVAGWRTQCHRG